MTRLSFFLSSDRAIYFLVALFVVLGALYSITTPIFEAGDELWHYPYVQWVSRGNGLPVQDPAQKQLWAQEGGQPPLFYVLAAASTFWIDTGDMRDRLWRNPYAKIGVPLAYGNKNMVVHTSAEQFPWQGTTLAVHLIRLLCVLFSAGTVYLTYGIVREICAPLLLAPSPAAPSVATPSPAETSSRTMSGARRERDDVSLTPLPMGDAGGLGRISESGSDTWGAGPREAALALIAAAIVAFNPMFLFISASVNNDALAALCASGAMFLIVRLVTRGAANRSVLVLGIVIALAILTKVSNVALIAVALVVLAYSVRRNKKHSAFSHLAIDYIRLAVLLLIPFILLNGWWFARNYVLYGDPLAFNVWLQIAGGRPPTTVMGLISEFQGFRISFWGNFGGVNIIAPEWVYVTLDIFTLLALVGILVGVFRRTLPALWWIPALQVVVVMVALIRWTLMTFASQGRLIFPAIAAVSILITFGLYSLTDQVIRLFRQPAIGNQQSSGIRLALPALAALLLFFFALAAPWLIMSVYAAPQRITDEAAVPNPVHITYNANGGQPELLGFKTTRFLQPGQELPLTLYWRTASPVEEDLALFIHVYDVKGNLIGQWDAYPGNGLYPPSLWQPNEISVDEYRVPVNPAGAYPPLGRIEVGMSRVGSSRVLTAQNPQGETVVPSLATFKFARPDSPPARAELAIGDQFQLVNLGLLTKRGMQEIHPEPNKRQRIEVKPGDVLYVGLVLQALKTPDDDYTLFTHLVDANGKIAAQQDAQPLDNTYPTSLWNSGEQVSIILPLDIPRDAAGEYTLEFGLYRKPDLQRLPMNGEALGLWRAAGDHLVIPVEIAQ